MGGELRFFYYGAVKSFWEEFGHLLHSEQFTEESHFVEFSGCLYYRAELPIFLNEQPQNKYMHTVV